jgi:probable phosphoglycerate mutase
LASPLRRARETCELAGLGDAVTLDDDLVEWNYGKYEGLTYAEIQALAPGWGIFRDGCPGGERPDEVGARADRIIVRAREAGGDIALFAHGHVLRVLAARWLGLPAAAGEHFLLDTSTLSILADYRGMPAVRTWNQPLMDLGATRASPER